MTLLRLSESERDTAMRNFDRGTRRAPLRSWEAGRAVAARASHDLLMLCRAAAQENHCVLPGSPIGGHESERFGVEALRPFHVRDAQLQAAQR